MQGTLYIKTRIQREDRRYGSSSVTLAAIRCSYEECEAAAKQFRANNKQFDGCELHGEFIAREFVYIS